MLLRAFFVLSALTVQVTGQDCSFCADGNTPNFNPAVVPFSNGFINCTDLNEQRIANELQASDSACGTIQLTAYQGGCCASPPFSFCTVCPDGSSYQGGNEVTRGWANNPTCSQLDLFSIYAAYNGVSEAGSCQGTFLQRGAFYCGCAGEEQKCNVCSDGGSVRTPRKRDPFIFNSDCAGIAYFYSVSTEQECQEVSFNFGLDYEGFCGCGGSNSSATMAENGETCSFCPEGEEVKDTSTGLVYDPDNCAECTCGLADSIAPFVTRESRCAAIGSTTAREACCVKKSGGAVLSVIASLVFVGGMTIQALF
jgi:hypothetical protein